MIPEGLKELAQSLKLRVYHGTPEEDLMFLNWHIDRVRTNTLKDVLTPEGHSISGMFSVFKDKMVLYAEKGGRFEYLFWATPGSEAEAEEACFLGVWVGKHLIGTKRSILLALASYRIVFCRYQYCLITTWQEKLLDTFRDIGYTLAGFIPSLYGVRNVYLLLLSKKHFAESKFMRIANKIEVRL